MDRFHFNAPQYADFNSPLTSDDEEAERYFDFDHECDDSHVTAMSTNEVDASEDKIDSKPAMPKSSENKTSKRKRYAKDVQPPQKFLCMAEAIEKFHKTTPARFHTKPRNMKFEFKDKRQQHLKSTVPISPHLQVAHRNRPVTALSRWQVEEMEVEEMKKHQIKARPMNDKIFKPSNFNVSHQSHVTEIVPFNLTECKRKTEEPLPRVVKFTARPVPKGLFKKREGRQNVSAPHIPFRQRVPIMKEKEKEVIKPARKGSTCPHPFSFEERNKMLRKKKEDMIKKCIEEENSARIFHANPLPKFPSTLQEKSTIVPTVPQPFHLSADDKGQANREKWERKIEEEKRLLKKAAEFKAKPATVLSQKPFIPTKSEHTIEICDIVLNTEVRAKERALFDMELKEREEELEKMKMERKKELERQEEKEIVELRKKTVHKANPIRNYKKISIHPSNKSLTLPMNPHSFT